MKVKEKIRKVLTQGKLFPRFKKLKKEGGSYYRNMSVDGKFTFKLVKAEVKEIVIPAWEAFQFIMFKEYLPNLCKGKILILEVRTGLEVGRGDSELEAIDLARNKFVRFAKTEEGLEKLILNGIGESGLSPMFKTEEKQQ